MPPPIAIQDSVCLLRGRSLRGLTGPLRRLVTGSGLLGLLLAVLLLGLRRAVGLGGGLLLGLALRLGRRGGSRAGAAGRGGGSLRERGERQSDGQGNCREEGALHGCFVPFGKGGRQIRPRWPFGTRHPSAHSNGGGSARTAGAASLGRQGSGRSRCRRHPAGSRRR